VPPVAVLLVSIPVLVDVEASASLDGSLVPADPVVELEVDEVELEPLAVEPFDSPPLESSSPHAAKASVSTKAARRRREPRSCAIMRPIVDVSTRRVKSRRHSGCHPNG
jgi:hypothetical protein